MLTGVDNRTGVTSLSTAIVLGRLRLLGATIYS
jgi:hypothetical protein